MEREIGKHKETERGSPFYSMRPFEDMERWFDESIPRGWMHRWARPSLGELTRPLEYLSPRIDLIDRDDEIVLTAEIPGVKKEDMDISVTENTLTLQGGDKHETEEKEGEYYRHEIVHGGFTRTVSLPSMVNTEKAEASFKDGMLEVRIPKISKSKRRHIELS